MLATKDPCPISTFDASTEGWWTIEDAGNQRWDAAIGNPPGSFGADDLVQSLLWVFTAPGKFLGNCAIHLGGSVEFDLHTSGVDATLGDPVITLTGGGNVLRYQANYLPTAGQWTHYSVPLLPSSEWTLNDGVTQATDAHFLQVLGALQQFLIRGEYWNGPDVGHIDNIRFTFCHVCLLPGDVNESAQVDLSDLPIFMDAIMGLSVTDAQRRCADVNEDYRVDGRDISAMVQAVLDP